MKTYTDEQVRITRCIDTLVQQRGAIDRELTRKIEQLRKAGASWSRVGFALGVSGQAAWERYSGLARIPGDAIPQETLPDLENVDSTSTGLQLVQRT